MPHDLAYEDPEATFFITTRTIGSRLWFVNNRQLEWYILAFLAKYQEKYGVLLYGFILMGNHYHLIARFPNSNKAAFLRAFNGIIARLTTSHVKGHDGGKLWARRARVQILPRSEDIEHWILYAALNPVSSGLVRRSSEYPLFNSFSDALAGKRRTFKLLKRGEFNDRKRSNRRLTMAECTETFELRFDRLPGYEDWSQKDYALKFHRKAEERRCELLKTRSADKKGFAGRRRLLQIRPGTKPQTTKTSDRFSKRPLVLTLCSEAKRIFLERYFLLVTAFRMASQRFRNGHLTIEFPPGTYRPALLNTP